MKKEVDHNLIHCYDVITLKVHASDKDFFQSRFCSGIFPGSMMTKFYKRHLCVHYEFEETNAEVDAICVMDTPIINTSDSFLRKN